MNPRDPRTSDPNVTPLAIRFIKRTRFPFSALPNAAAMSTEPTWCVVTGGRGFAARHLVAMLLQHGGWLVRVADLGPTINLDPAEEDGPLGQALRSGRAVYVSADLRNKDEVIKGEIFCDFDISLSFFVIFMCTIVVVESCGKGVGFK